MLQKVILALILAVFLFSLAGCQTIEGLGRDIEWVGEQTGNAVE